jgi:hypothetical protein
VCCIYVPVSNVASAAPMTTLLLGTIPDCMTQWIHVQWFCFCLCGGTLRLSYLQSMFRTTTRPSMFYGLYQYFVRSAVLLLTHTFCYTDDSI